MPTTKPLIAFFEGLTDTVEERKSELARTSDFTKIKGPTGQHKSLDGTQSLPKDSEKTQNNLTSKDESVRTTSRSHRKNCKKIDNFTKKGATFKSSDHEIKETAIIQMLQLLSIQNQEILRKLGELNDRISSRTRPYSFDDLPETSEDSRSSSSLSYPEEDEHSDDAFGSNSFDHTEEDHYFVETYNDDVISILQISQYERSDNIQEKIQDAEDIIHQSQSMNGTEADDTKSYTNLPTSYRSETNDQDAEAQASNLSTSHNAVHVFGASGRRKPSRSKSIIKKKEKLHFIIDELIKTEESYIKGLAKVVNNYMGYMYDQTPQDLIFGNIRSIYENAKDFHLVLRTRGYDAAAIAQTFVDFAPQFELLYPLYSKTKPTTNIYLQQFDSVIKERQRQLGDNLGLASHLLTPIQRLGKYVLLLENLQKDRPTENISAAINVVRKIMRKSNDYIAIDSIKHSPVDLSDKGSCRMRSVFTIHKPWKFESMVFLFDHIVVFTENTPVWQGVPGVENYPQRYIEHFNYVDSIAMSDLSIDDLQESPCIFKLINYTKAKSNHPNAIFVLEAEVAKIKDDWTKTIAEILWTQLELVKEQRKNQSCVQVKDGITTKAANDQDEKKNLWFKDVSDSR